VRYPAPEGFATAKVKPASAFFSKELSEFLLSYDAVRKASDQPWNADWGRRGRSDRSETRLTLPDVRFASKADMTFRFR
jgi:hypothetical protein